jgi:Nucleotidyl transferase of unknown function (DUF2204)
MSELDHALVTLSSWLTENGIGHMVIGGFAVTVWGEPRFTRDLDVTVSVPADKFSQTVDFISSRFTSLSNDPVKFAAETRVLPIMVESVPVDLIFAALPYEEDAIARARPIKLKNGTVPVCSPEDLILHKIVSPRPRDHEDIEGVFRYRHKELDYGYLDPRVEELADALSDRNMLDWYHRIRQRWGSG